MLSSHWGRTATGKKKSCVSAHRVALVVSDSMRPCRLWPARLLSGKEILQARRLERIGQYLLPHPSRALYFLLPYPPTPLGTCSCHNQCNPSSAPPSHLALTGANPSSPGQAQEQTPADDSHAEVEIRPQLKPRGRVAKEEDPKPSHQM